MKNTMNKIDATLRDRMQSIVIEYRLLSSNMKKALMSNLKNYYWVGINAQSNDMQKYLLRKLKDNYTDEERNLQQI